MAAALQQTPDQRDLFELGCRKAIEETLDPSDVNPQGGAGRAFVKLKSGKPARHTLPAAR